MLVQEINLQRSFSFRCNLIFCFGKSKTYMPMRPMRGTAYIYIIYNNYNYNIVTYNIIYIINEYEFNLLININRASPSLPKNIHI